MGPSAWTMSELLPALRDGSGTLGGAEEERELKPRAWRELKPRAWHITLEDARIRHEMREWIKTRHVNGKDTGEDT